MRFDIVTLFPSLFAPFLEIGVSGRAFVRGLAQAKFWNPRDYAANRRRTVDDRPFGGGGGMVLSPTPMSAAVRAAKSQNSGAVIHFTPRGERFDDQTARRLAREPGVILLCGRYRGIDERVCEMFADLEISLGDYVLSGGETAAMALMEAVLRYLPGVLGNEESVADEAFADGGLDAPCYTRPEVFEGRRVPAPLLSGDHAAVREWRQAARRRLTERRRPDLSRRQKK